MKRTFAQVASPGILLYVYLAFTSLARGLYFASDVEPPGVSLLYSAGLLWLVGWWLLRDSRKRGVEWVYDMGFFLAIAWPLIMPYYLLKTRGVRKGLLLISAFAATFIAAFALGMALYLLLSVSKGRTALR